MEKIENAQISVREAIKYIHKYEEAAWEVTCEFYREREKLYRVYAIDDKILSGEEIEIYNKKVIRSSMDVPSMAQLLIQLTEELVWLKILVSETLGKAGIRYEQDKFLKDKRLEEKLRHLSAKSAVVTRKFMASSSHMSPEDEIQDYQYPVIETKRMLADQALAERIAADMQQRCKEYDSMMEAQSDSIFIDYIPRFDIHADWHSWTAEK